MGDGASEGVQAFHDALYSFLTRKRLVKDIPILDDDLPKLTKVCRPDRSGS